MPKITRVLAKEAVTTSGAVARCLAGLTTTHLPHVLRLDGEDSNRIFAELADWEELLKGSSLAQRPEPPAP